MYTILKILIIFNFLLYFHGETKHEKLIFSRIFYPFSSLLSGFQTEPKGNDFIMFGSTVENIKENKKILHFLQYQLFLNCKFALISLILKFNF